MPKIVLYVPTIDVAVGIDYLGLPFHIPIHPCAEYDLTIFQLDHSLALQDIMIALLLLDGQFLSHTALKPALGLFRVLGFLVLLSREKSLLVI